MGKLSLPAKQAARLLSLQLKNIVAPERCLGCLIEGTWLCYGCNAETAKKYPAKFKTTQIPPELAGLLSAGAYSDKVLQRGITWLKFKSVKDVAKPLARILKPTLIRMAPINVLAKDAVLVPIPLHKNRLRQRGFNQAEEISKQLSVLTKIPVINIIQRKKATAKQTDLPDYLRKNNVAETFSVDTNKAEYIYDKRFVIIIDDVTTTGATLAAAAKAIKPNLNSLTQIWGLTIARGR